MVLDHPSSNVRFTESAFSFDMGFVYSFIKQPRPASSERGNRDDFWESLGGWVSQMCADTVVFLVEVEGNGVETDYIPEWARARPTGVDANLEERTAHLPSIRGVGESAVYK